MPPLDALLIDVGGTIWPERGPLYARGCRFDIVTSLDVGYRKPHDESSVSPASRRVATGQLRLLGDSEEEDADLQSPQTPSG